MRQDYADITLVVDRSGSMTVCKDDAQGGINEFLSKQLKEEGEVKITLVEFNNDYQVRHEGAEINDVLPYEMHPAGGTALLDAIGTGINTTGARLRDMDEKDRPGLVLFVIVTDGHENSSRKFGNDKIREMIEHQQEKYGWNFEFLGANQDAFASAWGIGIGANNAADYCTSASKAAYDGLSAKTSRMRSTVMGPEGPQGPAGPMGQALKMNYTDEEREAMMKPAAESKV